MVTIRPLQHSDRWAIKHFECASRNDPSYQRRIQHLVRKELLATVHDPKRDISVHVAVDEGKLSGVIVTERDGDDLDLTLVAVSQSSRRKGVASALINHALSSDSAKDAAFVTLDVHKENVGMRALLSDCGEFFPTALDPDYEVFVTEPAALRHQLDGKQVAADIPSTKSLVLD